MIGFTLSTLLGVSQATPIAAQLAPQLVEPSNVPAQGASLAVLASAYTLGSGDVIQVTSFDTPELVLEQRYGILVDGTVTLPWIGAVSLQGLTLSEATQLLRSKYQRFIRNPVITVSLVGPRPLKLGVVGEVNRPGSYVISLIRDESLTQDGATQRVTRESGVGEGGRWPTVSSAIRTAGGITQLANIRQVQVRRPNLVSGTEDLINLDLWKLLQGGDLSQDMPLRDGDTVVIPKATDLSAAEVTQVAVSNFAPATIKVNVVGEVNTPGAISIRPNSTLNQAVLAAGGLKNDRASRKVELIRLNPNGTVSAQIISMNLGSGLNETTNPALRDNDIVVIRRNTYGGVTDVLNTVLSPISSFFGFFNVIR
jgi:polysaccharide export outer membrane protein